MKRTFLAIATTLDLLILGNRGLANSLQDQAPPPVLNGLPAFCSIVSRSDLPEAIVDPGRNNVEIRDAIAQLSLSRQFAAALTLMQSLEPSYKSAALAALPVLLRQAEEFGTAAEKRAVEQLALQLFGETAGDDLLVKMFLLNALVQEALQRQQVDQAVAFSVEVVKSFNGSQLDRASRWETLRDVIAPYRSLKHRSAALKVGDASSDPILRAAVRQMLAEDALKAGQPAETEELLRQALALVRSQSGSDKQVAELQLNLLISLALLPGLQPEELKTLVAEATPKIQALPDKSYKAQLLIDLATLQQRLGQPQAAEQSLRQMQAIAQQIAKTPTEHHLLASLARSALKRQRVDLADQLLDLALKTTLIQESVRENFSRLYAQAGLIDRGLQISAPLANDYLKEAIQTEIAISALKAGQLEKAMALSSRFQEASNKKRFAIEAITHLLKTNQEQAALKLAQQPATYDALLLLLGRSGQRPDLNPYTPWLVTQATRVANTFPAAGRQRTLKELAEQVITIERFDLLLPLWSGLQDPALVTELNQRLLYSVRGGLRSPQETSIVQFLTALPDSTFKFDLWQEVMQDYARRGRSLTVLPSTSQALEWVKGDRDKQYQLFQTYQNLRAFAPALELLEALKPSPETLDVMILRLDLLLESGNLAAAQQQLPQFRQLSNQVLQELQAQSGRRLPEQIATLTFLAPYYAELGDRTTALAFLAQATKLQEQPAFGKQPVKEQNRSVAQTVIAYARVAHSAALAGERDGAEQAIAQGQAALKRLQPYRPDIVAAQTLACVRSTYDLK